MFQLRNSYTVGTKIDSVETLNPENDFKRIFKTMDCTSCSWYSNSEQTHSDIDINNTSRHPL
jgi:hypothetical protein